MRDCLRSLYLAQVEGLGFRVSIELDSGVKASGQPQPRHKQLQLGLLQSRDPNKPYRSMLEKGIILSDSH